MNPTELSRDPGDPVIGIVGVVVPGVGRHHVDAADPGAGLAPELARQAWVRCVTDIHLGPVHESALHLDEAAAIAEAGHADSAVMLVGMAEWLVEELVAAAEAEMLPRPAHDELHLILRTVEARSGECTVPHAVTHRLGEWLDRLDEAGVPVDETDGHLGAVDRVAEFLSAGETSGADAVHQVSDLAVDSGSVDVTGVPPRLIASRPAGGEVLVEFALTAGTPVSATATVALVAGVDPDVRELTRLRLVAFGSRGELVAVAALEPRGGVLATRIEDRRALEKARSFIVTSADSGLVGLRGDDRSEMVRTVERLTRHAWTAARLAAIGASEQGRAASLAERAAALLDTGVARYPDQAAGWVTRRDALREWAASTAPGAGVGGGSGSAGAANPARPLLAEMLDVTWDD